VASRSDLSGKRVLVTGASGFTGRYMVAELRAHGCHVISLGAQTEPSDDASATDESYAADLREPSALVHVLKAAQPNIIIHLAALAFVAHGSADDFYNVNLIGTRNLLQAAEDAGIALDRLLLASSANVYGNTSEGVLSEETLPAPANDYAVSKLAMEYVASLWRGRLPITIARPFNYTGVGQSGQFLVPKIVSHFARRADVLELGNLEVSRDFGDVRAVVAAYRQLLQAPEAEGVIVNVCSGRGHTLLEIVGMCEFLTGHSLDVRVNPAFVRPNEVRVLLGDNRRLKRLIGGWDSPSLRETLAWMLDAEKLS
jgi:nucleoside-diphosphate-sugar epimerase